MDSSTIKFYSKLLKCEDYRTFLRSFFHEENSPYKLSYQAFANRAGYSSKSYLSEILSGKKTLSFSSTEKFCKGLGLNKALSDFFKNLVLMDLKRRSYLEKEINELKKKNYEIELKILSSFNKIDVLNSKTTLHTIMLQENFPGVYASLGTPQEGSTLEEIAARTCLSKSTVRNILTAMEEVKIVAKRDEDRFYALTNSLDFDFLNSNEYFKRNFIRSSERAIKRLSSQIEDQNSLFMTQTFSVDSKNLPKLKEALKEFIHNFSNESENSNGNKISEICISFTYFK